MRISLHIDYKRRLSSYAWIRPQLSSKCYKSITMEVGGSCRFTRSTLVHSPNWSTATRLFYLRGWEGGTRTERRADKRIHAGVEAQVCGRNQVPGTGSWLAGWLAGRLAGNTQPHVDNYVFWQRRQFLSHPFFSRALQNFIGNKILLPLPFRKSYEVGARGSREYRSSLTMYG